jgi:uncharacterized iron-regulated membrane protein
MEESTNYTGLVVAGSISAILLIVLVMFGGPIYGRYQAREEKKNDILVTELEATNTKQRIDIEKQKAQIRVAEAHGIAESQAIINSSLTGNYLQYLAIQAQEKMAGSQNHTQIYVPSGQNGIPLVFSADGNK